MISKMSEVIAPDVLYIKLSGQGKLDGYEGNVYKEETVLKLCDIIDNFKESERCECCSKDVPIEFISYQDETANLCYKCMYELLLPNVSDRGKQRIINELPEGDTI